MTREHTSSLGRVAEEEETAELVVFPASPMASYVNDAVLQARRTDGRLPA